MPANALWIHIDGDRVVQSLLEAQEKLDIADSELALDFSSVQRMDVAALGTLEKLASAAGTKPAKVVLRGVNVEVYKVLKLLKLAPRFSFTA
jgi:anti-anti-sigma regulatory factor